MIKQPIKVMIKLDNNDNVLDIISIIFLENNENYIIIDEGYGDKYAHAQSQYLDKPCIVDGKPTYRYKKGKFIENK